MTDRQKRAKALALLRQGRSRLHVCVTLGVDAGQLSRWVLSSRNGLPQKADPND